MGLGDPFFSPAGARAFRSDVPDAEVHLLDTGHFALETDGPAIALLIRAFLDRHAGRFTSLNYGMAAAGC